MITRYFGLDVHKNYVVVAAVDREQQPLMGKERIPMARFAKWVEQNLTRFDEVALEVTTNSWPVVDLIRAHAGRVVVVNPYKTKLIAEAQIKNDKVDADALAKLLAANFICEVWVPTARVRQQRSLATHRAKLQRQCTKIKNSLHSILHRHNLRCPESSLFSRAGQEWLNSCPLPEPEGLRARHLLSQLVLLEEQLQEADGEVARWASRDPRVPILMQITGIGYFSAFAILAFIGNIERFPAPGKLTSYGGLVPRESQSGEHHYRGRITKAGHPLLRCLPWRVRPGDPGAGCPIGSSMEPALAAYLRSHRPPPGQKHCHRRHRSQAAGARMAAADPQVPQSSSARTNLRHQTPELGLQHRTLTPGG
jgi:transposase